MVEVKECFVVEGGAYFVVFVLVYCYGWVFE